MNFFKKHQKATFFVILFLIVGFFVFKIFGNKEQIRYQTAKVQSGDIVSSVSASGQVLSSNMVSVTTQASGVVKKIYVTDGEEVKKGDKILELELDSLGEQRNSAAFSQYQSAKNAYESAQIAKISAQSAMFAAWDKFKLLAESSKYQNADGSPRIDQRYLAEFNIAQDDWLSSEAKYKQQDALISQAQTALNNAWVSYQQTAPVVYAPSDGVISSFSVIEGSTVNTSLSSSSTISTNSSSSQKIAVISNDSLPILSFNLSEVDVPKVKIGQKAIVSFDSLGEGVTFTGKVMSVDRVGSVSSNVTNYSTIIELDSASSKILPNMASSAKIITNITNQVLYVPSSAISVSNGVSSVRVLKNGQPEVVQIETGASNDTQIEIKSGLKEGDEVVTGVISSGQQQTSTRSVFGGFGGGGGAVYRAR